jgi:4-oxalomesaconate tautomerase
MSDGIRCMWMRGGTSKGAYFLAGDLPEDEAERDRLLLEIMGSPDPRQIDGIGGADPLTSKVAIIRKSAREAADVDYLFLQVFVDQPIVTGAQGCGNILAGVGPFAIERGLVEARHGTTPVRIFMNNTGKIAIAEIDTPGGGVSYAGSAVIDGVPGAHAPVALSFEGVAGSSCGALLPTGNAMDVIDGVEVTLIDNGMPCVVMRAEDMGVSGYESREELEANEALRARLETIRLKAGPMMNLGDVGDKPVPKMTMIAPPRDGGAICTRTFIPHRCHASIGVFGAVSVATACALNGSPASAMAVLPAGDRKTVEIEHPAGSTAAVLTLGADGEVVSAGMLRTARKLFDGTVFPRAG